MAKHHALHVMSVGVPLALGCALLLVGVIGLRSCGPGGDGIIAHAKSEDGDEYLVTQKWNDWLEPYSIMFYFRRPEGHWGSCYIDHESYRWHSASMKFLDREDRVQVFAEGTLRAELRKSTSEFSLFSHSGKLLRTVTAPQAWREPRL